MRAAILKLAGDQPKNWRGPSQVLASTNPTTGKPPYPLNPVFADKPSQSRPFVLVFFFLVARVFGYVDALEVVMTAAQKEPFLTDAGRPAIKFVSGEEGLRPIPTKSNNSKGMVFKAAFGSFERIRRLSRKRL